MRLKGRQGRFLAATIGGWIALRVWLLWPGAPLAIGAVATAPVITDWVRPHFTAELPFVPRPAAHASALPAGPDPRAPDEDRAAGGTREDPPVRPAHLGLPAATQHALGDEADVDRAPSPPTLSPLPLRPPAPVRVASGSDGRAIEGQAYLFLRPGSGRATLAPGGSLGGSQAAARVAIALESSGPLRTAVAARLYAPLQTKGAEAAIGLDWHPLAGVPLRVSVERRIGLDRAGRNAWSAYTAGGFYRAHLPLGLEADGYGQAGVVGIHSRDLFADAAVRMGRRFAAGAAEAVVGAGMWGAAQPGTTRLDIGPRIAVSLPVDRHHLTLAVDGRLRVAGNAAPGSGATLTLAVDL